MNISLLLSALGYSDSGNYIPVTKLSPALNLKIPRQVTRLKDNSGNSVLNGSYFFRTASDAVSNTHNRNFPILKPAVYVAEVNTPKEARTVHEKLWNVGNAPFIIILLPGEIRIYTGFDYDSNNSGQGLLDSISLFDMPYENDLRVLDQYSAEAVDNGRIWQNLKNASTFNPENRVDKRLLKNLKDLENLLIAKLSDFSKEDVLPCIHALIGKYVYIRYLLDREILTPEWFEENKIDLSKILGENADLETLMIFDKNIEARFHGEVFPFPSNVKEYINDEIVSLTASVFKGNEASGQLILGFEMYDFSYIPVETLSFIYEQFLRAQNQDKKDGAVYTPEALADYVIYGVDSVKPLKEGIKILDPCCGSGLFLVLSYRKLLEQELENQQVDNLSPEEVRSILLKSIYGIERNLDACYVTEFSLLLTMLNYISPPHLHHNKDFHFPSLHNKRIFNNDFFDNDGKLYTQKVKFDWIVGNPPWTEPNSNSIADRLALSWMEKNQETRVVKGNRVAEAFTWRALEFVKKDGCIGFVLPATTLHNLESEDFRREFFLRNEVRQITDFSNFHYILFPTVDISAITLIYKEGNELKEKPPIVHYGPFVANQISVQIKKEKPPRPVWNIGINESEIRLVSANEAENGNALTWKLALWGSAADARAIDYLHFKFRKKLSHLCKEKRWSLSKGIELIDVKSKQERLSLDSYLEARNISKDNLKIFNAKKFAKMKLRFHVPSSALEVIPDDKRYIRKRGGTKGLAIALAPHIIVNPNYAVYSDENFIVGGGQIGISGADEDKEYFQALSVYLNSRVGRYLLFFNSSSWGIDRTILIPEELKTLPTPSFTDTQIDDLSKIYKDMERNESEFTFGSHYEQESINENFNSKIEQILDIPDFISNIIKDFIEIKLSLNKGRTATRGSVEATGVLCPSLNDLIKYAEQLRNELDGFARTGSIRHLIHIIRSPEMTVCEIKFVKSEETQPVKVANAEADLLKWLSIMKKALSQTINQWMYFQREAKIFLGSKFIYLCKSSRLINWTVSQSILDSNDIIADIISRRPSENFDLPSLNNYDNLFNDNSLYSDHRI